MTSQLRVVLEIEIVCCQPVVQYVKDAACSDLAVCVCCTRENALKRVTGAEGES